MGVEGPSSISLSGSVSNSASELERAPENGETGALIEFPQLSLRAESPAISSSESESISRGMSISICRVRGVPRGEGEGEDVGVTRGEGNISELAEDGMSMYPQSLNGMDDDDDSWCWCRWC